MDRNDTPARSAMRGAGGFNSPDSMRARRASTMDCRVRRARAERPSMTLGSSTTAETLERGAMDLLGTITAIPRQLGSLKFLGDTGIVNPLRPDRLVGTARTMARWGPTPAGGYAAAAQNFPDDVALIDERGALTFGALHRRTNALAHGLSALGVGAGDGVAVLCRNHRGFVEATVAASKLGADVLFLNTGFSSPQAKGVLDREGATAVVFDSEFADVVAEGSRGRIQVVAWHDGHSPI